MFDRSPKQARNDREAAAAVSVYRVNQTFLIGRRLTGMPAQPAATVNSHGVCLQ